MAFSFAAARNWASRGRLLFRLQAVLIGVLCFAAGAVPRLLPALFGTLALVVAMHVFTVQPRRAALAALVAVTAISALLSESGTSVMAFFVGALVLALAALSLKATRMLMVGAWTIVTLLAVPLGALPYDFGWERWTWLPPESVPARFYIWKYVGRRPCL